MLESLKTSSTERLGRVSVASVLDGKADCGWSLPSAECGETTKRCVSGHHCNSLLEQSLGDVWGGSAPIHLQGAGGLSRKMVLLPLSELCLHGVLQTDVNFLGRWAVQSQADELRAALGCCWSLGC